MYNHNNTLTSAVLESPNFPAGLAVTSFWARPWAELGPNQICNDRSRFFLTYAFFSIYNEFHGDSESANFQFFIYLFSSK
jgi:hypothetical protein